MWGFSDSTPPSDHSSTGPRASSNDRHRPTYLPQSTLSFESAGDRTSPLPPRTAPSPTPPLSASVSSPSPYAYAPPAFTSMAHGGTGTGGVGGMEPVPPSMASVRGGREPRPPSTMGSMPSMASAGRYDFSPPSYDKLFSTTTAPAPSTSTANAKAPIPAPPTTSMAAASPYAPARTSTVSTVASINTTSSSIRSAAGAAPDQPPPSPPRYLFGAPSTNGAVNGAGGMVGSPAAAAPPPPASRYAPSLSSVAPGVLRNVGRPARGVASPAMVMRAKEQADIVILMDVTGSMQRHIDNARDALNDIITKVREEIPRFEPRIAFVGYRDYSDRERFTVLDFTSDVNSAVEFIAGVVAEGGKDYPEDVKGGLCEVLKLDWRCRHKVLLHVADAPAHGVGYNGGFRDDYPDGGPGELTFDEIFRSLVELRVVYNFLRITPNCDQMIEKFNDHLSRYLSSKPIRVSDLGEKADVAWFLDLMVSSWTLHFLLGLVTTPMMAFEKPSCDGRPPTTAASPLLKPVTEETSPNRTSVASHPVSLGLKKQNPIRVPLAVFIVAIVVVVAGLVGGLVGFLTISDALSTIKDITLQMRLAILEKTMDTVNTTLQNAVAALSKPSCLTGCSTHQALSPMALKPKGSIM
ncbi:hypothetical protein HDU96_001060 [Phlyctochytrium bullatum]|nr:hypothetical protein HDU96_001060 [Phlyctochytrium bullatum]